MVFEPAAKVGGTAEAGFECYYFHATACHQAELGCFEALFGEPVFGGFFGVGLEIALQLTDGDTTEMGQVPGIVRGDGSEELPRLDVYSTGCHPARKDEQSSLNAVSQGRPD